jgi:amino acid transporter
LLALWTSDLLPSFFPAEQARMLDTSVDVRSIAFVIAISFASALLLALRLRCKPRSRLPQRHSRLAPVERRTLGRARGSDEYSSAAVAVAVVLLVSSVLLFKSLFNALNADWGFTTRSVSLPPSRLPSAEFQEAQGLVATATCSTAYGDFRA